MIDLEHIQVVELRGGYCLVDRRSGSPLTLADHETITDGIKRNSGHLRNRDYDAIVKANPITEDNVFWWPPLEPMDILAYASDFDFPCVYVGRSDAKPGYLKIGRTKSLSQRCKGHTHALGSTFWIVGWGHTDYHIEHEAVLLMTLNDMGFKRDGEWFDEACFDFLAHIFEEGHYGR